jgi:hypothetical protein
MNNGRTYFPLLGADIMGILRAAVAANPNIRIYGIEETRWQQKKNRGRSGSRDESIAYNFWNCYQPDRRHIILFGALHCTSEPKWLFGRVRAQAPFPLKARMLNLAVLEEHQNGPMESFIYFLDEIDRVKKNFVIADTNSLHPRLVQWFRSLSSQILEKYCAVVVFRTRSSHAE